MRGRGLASLACLGLCACEVPRALNPAEIYREVSGANDAARPTPPGLDRPFPNLGSVPPRPDRPSPEAREAITAALAADRDLSREPFALRTAPGEGARPPPGMSAGPPPRPALAAAPRIPWTETPPPSARGGGASPPAAFPARAPGPAAPVAAPVPDVPDAAPAPPPPDLLGAPPPPPPPDLLAPPPARR